MEHLPLVSLHGISEYLVADVTRRAALVAQACGNKNDAAAARYQRAREELLRILPAEPRFTRALRQAAEDLREKLPHATSNWQESDIQLSADSLEVMADVVEEVELGNGVIKRRKKAWPLLTIGGVRISVAPDLIVRHEGEPVRLGALKFRFSVGRKMSDQEGEYASTILRYFLQEKLTDDNFRIRHQSCQIVDVFARNVFVAKRAYKTRMRHVEKACREFAVHRSSLEVPPASDDRSRPPSQSPEGPTPPH